MTDSVEINRKITNYYKITEQHAIGIRGFKKKWKKNLCLLEQWWKKAIKCRSKLGKYVTNNPQQQQKTLINQFNLLDRKKYDSREEEANEGIREKYGKNNDNER